MLLSVLGVLIVGGCISSLSASKGTSTSSTASAVPAPSPEVSQAPVATISQAFRSEVRDKLGNSNRDGVQRVKTASVSGGNALVELAFNDNLTEGLTKGGAHLDTINLVKIAKKVPGVKALHIVGTFSLKDQLGRVSEDEVANVTYSSDFLAAVQPDNIDPKTTWQIADGSSFVHPAFQN